MTDNVRELMAKHPLPWTADILMIRDANKRQVLHLGGSRDEVGRVMDPDFLVELNRLTVAAANAALAASEPTSVPRDKVREAAFTKWRLQPKVKAQRMTMPWSEIFYAGWEAALAEPSDLQAKLEALRELSEKATKGPMLESHLSMFTDSPIWRHNRTFIVACVNTIRAILEGK